MAANSAEPLGAGQLGAEDTLSIRAFFGLPVPEAHCQQLEPYLAACAARAPEFRWTPVANLHLTIRFIGNVEPSVAEGIADRLAEQQLVSFTLELGDVGTFKRGRLVRVVWLQLRVGAEPARELAAQVEAECVRAGLVPEARPFQPHLTVARARSRDGNELPALPATPDLPPWRADELVLYRSHQGRAGAVYEPIRSLRLS
ncbi:MAG TPA: RNA 2',3'-cyclic phosphodiesterase [Candidatus Dormibacteraeota bacterium]|nr:RNA 2',3'-cyclic phosphodiesterase [Candidatus Dormibacteraeota bacterium]